MPSDSSLGATVSGSASSSPVPAVGRPHAKWPGWISPRIAGGAFGLLLLGSAWLLPPLWGLGIDAQRFLGLILFIVSWCAFRVVPEGLVAMLFFLIAIGTKLGPPSEVLGGWTEPVLWFNIAAFGISYAFQITGLGQRFSLLVLSRTGVRYPVLVAVIFLMNVLFSLIGLAALGRLAILLSVIAGIGTATGLKPADTGFRGLVMAAVGASTLGGLLLLTGAAVNPLAMRLAGTSILYSQWLTLFGPIVAVAMVIMAVAIPYVWPMHKPLSTGNDQFRIQLAGLGPVTPAQWRVIAILALSILLWNLDFWHRIDPAWIALLTAVLLMTPGVGVISFQDFVTACGWNTIFFVAVMLGVARMLPYTHLNLWMADRLTSIPLPTAPVGFLLSAGLIALVLHVPIGTSITTMSIAIPAMAVYGSLLGYNPQIVAFVIYSVLWGQFFLPYQHIATIYAMGQPGFRQTDLYRFGVLSGAVILATLVLVGIPYWSALDVLHG